MFVLVDMRDVADTVTGVAAALPTESVSTYLQVLGLAAANGLLDPAVHALSVDAIVNRWSEDDPRWDLLPAGGMTPLRRGRAGAGQVRREMVPIPMAVGHQSQERAVWARPHVALDGTPACVRADPAPGRARTRRSVADDKGRLCGHGSTRPWRIA